MKYGLIKVAAAIPGVRVADVDYNVQQIENLIAQAEGKGAEVIVFPELASRGESGGNGVSYRDFLHVFLFLENGSSKNFRLMDICEMDIRRTDGNSSFCMDNCLDGFGIRTVCVSSFGYRFISEGEVSYN